jgi:LacI family transcriptional regulator
MRKRFPNERATIEDVATLAGVSKGTVSKHLSKNDDYYVSQVTRDRIASAVAELDFQPNAIAQGLVQRRTRTVGVIVASIANPIYPEIIAGVDEILEASGITLIFGSSEGSAAKETDVVRSMRQRQVDGIVMASVTMQDGEVSNLVKSGTNVVLASRNLNSDLVDTVVVNNADGSDQAVRHLAGHGHRRVAHIAGPQDVVPFAVRCSSYRQACENLGLDLDDALVVEASSSTQEAGADALRRLLDAPVPPSAVFVGSDGMALGVLEECDRRGMRVPDDLAVIGFDNVWVARMAGIQLTTVDSRAREVGRLAATQLLNRIEARWSKRNTKTSVAAEITVLPTELIVRRTCGCKPGAVAPALEAGAT